MSGIDPFFGLLLAAGLMALATGALGAATCERRAHVTAVEWGHADLGQGLVRWTWSWSNEGVADDLILADCATGQSLTARVRAQNMTESVPYDRRDRAERVLTRLTALAARPFFTFEGLRAALAEERVPATIAPLAEPACACLAFYPELSFKPSSEDDR